MLPVAELIQLLSHTEPRVNFGRRRRPDASVFDGCEEIAIDLQRGFRIVKILALNHGRAEREDWIVRIAPAQTLNQLERHGWLMLVPQIDEMELVVGLTAEEQPT